MTGQKLFLNQVLGTYNFDFSAAKAHIKNHLAWLKSRGKTECVDYRWMSVRLKELSDLEELHLNKKDLQKLYLLVD